MAASPQFKVYSKSGEYLASVKYAEDAAILLGALGQGTTLRYGHSIRQVLWREGYESFSAAESYDATAKEIQDRLSKEG